MPGNGNQAAKELEPSEAHGCLVQRFLSVLCAQQQGEVFVELLNVSYSARKKISKWGSGVNAERQTNTQPVQCAESFTRKIHVLDLSKPLISDLDQSRPYT